MDSKENLRQQVRKELKSFWASESDREEALQSFTEHMLVFLKEQTGTWAAFQALPGEPRLESAVAASSHLRWVYPRVENQELSFWEPSGAKAFVGGSYGIQEPDPQQSQRYELENIEGVFAPGLAFDQRGARLGKGKSFYDRALKNYRGIKVGVGFSWQVRESLPTDPWDIFMDVLVTERGVHDLRS